MVQENLAEKLVVFVEIIRRDGFLPLEKELSSIEDPLLRSYLEKIIDGVEQTTVQSELSLHYKEVMDGYYRRIRVFFCLFVGSFVLAFFIYLFSFNNLTLSVLVLSSLINLFMCYRLRRKMIDDGLRLSMIIEGFILLYGGQLNDLKRVVNVYVEKDQNI